MQDSAVKGSHLLLFEFDGTSFETTVFTSTLPNCSLFGAALTSLGSSGMSSGGDNAPNDYLRWQANREIRLDSFVGEVLGA